MQEEHNVDPDAYKGLLPVYMREGIPPYLQILFSARPPLPYVKPKDVSRIPVLRGISEDLHRIRELKHVMDEKRAERLRKEQEEANNNAKHHKLTPQEKEALWFNNMKEHVTKVKEEYKDWAKNQKYSNEEKTRNAFKTLIVYNLVI